MRLGYSITSAVPPGTDAGIAADRVVERARIAEAAGFDLVETGDHHNVSGGSYLQNVPMAARLTEIFDRVGPLFLLPLYNPVLVAEQMGTIGALCPEPEFWCAVGSGPEQFRAFNVPIDERAPRFEEAMELLPRLWTGDHVTFEGEYYSFEDVSVNPKVQPRVVIGGTAEPAVRRAGRLGDCWAANADVPLAAIEERIGWVEDAGGAAVSVRRDVLALPDREEAIRRKDQLMSNGYRGWPADADWVWAGDADDIAARMDDLADIGVEEVVCRPMSDEHAEATLREIGRARDGE